MYHNFLSDKEEKEMKKNRISMYKLVGLVIFSLLVVLGFGEKLDVKVEAAEARTIILHKKKFSETQANVQNTGQQMPVFDSVDGLNGIEFKVYDVSTEFYDAITAGNTVENAQAVVATTDISGKTAVATGLTAANGSEDGYLSFNLPSVDDNGKNLVYLVTETTKEGANKAANMVVAFPVYEVTGTSDGKLLYGDTELQTIHLYPKNVVLRGSLIVEKKSTIPDLSVDGAKFVIHRKGDYGISGTEYYKVLKVDGIIEWTTDPALAKQFTITSGSFFADGLEFGDYYFTEVVAPVNHGIINAQTVNHPFTIATNSLNASFTGADAVKNDGMAIAKVTGKNTNNDYDYNIGESIPYTITVPIPLGIADELSDNTNRYTSFEIIDTHASQLTFEPTGYVLKADTTTINSSAYTVTPTATGFTVQLNAGFQALLSGKNNLVFTYNMDLNGTSVLEQGYENAATVTTNLSTASTTSESVMTYGKRFIKVDADNNNIPLAGTTFIVRSSDSNTANYLKQVVTTGQVTSTTWTGNSSERREFVTDSTGVIDIVGLKAGTYWLEEVTPPTGYVKLTSRISFTVNANSYYDGESILTTNVVNKHKGTLPVTGGMGIYVIIGIGVLAMILSGVWYVKRRIA